MDEKRDMKRSQNVKEVSSMLTLYEASFLKADGEEILDKSSGLHIHSPLTSQGKALHLPYEQVIHALRRPIWMDFQG